MADNCKSDVRLTPRYNILVTNPLTTTSQSSCSLITEEYISLTKVTVDIDGATYITGFTITPNTELLNSILVYGPTIIMTSPSGVEYTFYHTSNGVYVPVGSQLLNEDGDWTYALTCFEYLMADGSTVCTTDITVTETLAVVYQGPEAAFAYAANDADEFTIEFDATASVNNYPAGSVDTLRYTWDFGDASTTGPIIGDKTPSHTYAANGTYEILLTVTDESNTDATYTQTVIIQKVPTIDSVLAGVCTLATGLISLPVANTDYTLYDGNTDAAKLEWGFYRANTGLAISATSFGVPTDNIIGHSNYLSGTYTSPVLDYAALVAQYGLTASDGIIVKLRVSDQSNAISDYYSYGAYYSPVVAFTATPSDVTPGEYALDASTADLPDGDAIADYTYVWDFGDSNTSTIVGVATTTHTYAGTGAYTVALEMYKDCPSASSSIAVTVASFAPTAVIDSATYTLNVLAQEVAIVATGSTSGISGEVNTDLFYAYDFGDGNTEASTLGNTGTTHTYASNGTYTITLTVTDSLGRTDTTTTEVVIAELPVDAQADLVINDDGQNLITGSSDASYAFDSDLEPDSYKWELLDDALTEIETESGAGTGILGGTYVKGTGLVPTIDALPLYENVLCVEAPTAVIAATEDLITAGDWTLDSSGSDDGGCAGGFTSVQWIVYDEDGTTELFNTNTDPFTFTMPDATGTYPVTLRVNTACGYAFAHTSVVRETLLSVLESVSTDGVDSEIDTTGSIGSTIRVYVDSGSDASIDYLSADEANTGANIFDLAGFVVADGDTIYVEVDSDAPVVTETVGYLVPDSAAVLTDYSDTSAIAIDITGVFDAFTTTRDFLINYYDNGILVGTETVSGLVDNFTHTFDYASLATGDGNFTVEITANDEILTELTPFELELQLAEKTVYEIWVADTEDELPNSILSAMPNDPFSVTIFINGKPYRQTDSTPAFTASGQTVQWIAANAGSIISVGTEIVVEYNVNTLIDGHLTVTEVLTVLATDTLPALSNTPSDVTFVKGYINNEVYTPLGSLPLFTVAGTVATWQAANAPFTLDIGEEVIMEYTLDVSGDATRTYRETMDIVQINVFPSDLTFTPNDAANIKVHYRNAVLFTLGALPPVSAVGTVLSWTGNYGTDLFVGEQVVIEYTYDA